MAVSVRIGIDTGGTFTDFVIYSAGKIHIKKLLSTSQNPALAIIKGIAEYENRQHELLIIHGTTVATNALLEKSGTKIAFLTTRGFEDILHIGRQTRKHLYSLKGEEIIPLLPVDRCFGLHERVTAQGNKLQGISPEELQNTLKHLHRHKVEAVAVSLINSYANPVNEKNITRQLKKAGFQVSASSEILPEYREYERATVTAVNAYLLPVISCYLNSLEKKLTDAELRIMQSNEGYISPLTAKNEPIRTALSGPAGGVVAAFHIARAAGYNNIITFDMGGTSSDVSLVDGRIRRTNESFIGEFPIRLPIIDIHTVGAGGGSIAFLDRGGSLRVGPQSAGSDPGPACYGSGFNPTVTDANLVLGRLVPDFFLGGKMKIFPDRSRQAIGKLAHKMNKSIVQAAAGIIQIANANMEKALRVISIERGIDPRSYTLLSFGGAGGLHAVEMAANLNLPHVLVPKNAGVLSALGLLMADSIKDYSRSILKTSDKITAAKLDQFFSDLSHKGMRDMIKEGFRETDIKLQYFLDLRYMGQSYEITIPYRTGKDYLREFHRTHKQLYSYFHTHQKVEIVNIRVRAVGASKKIRLKKHVLENTNADPALHSNQDLYFNQIKYSAPVYVRSRLSPGNKIKGPALVADLESTTLLPPGYNLSVDPYLNLLISQETK